MKERILIEDALKHTHACEYEGRAVSPESLAGALALPLEQAGELLAELQQTGLILLEDGCYGLTSEGRLYARQVIRSHRLYETYLADLTGIEAPDWHRKAEKREHRMTGTEREKIAKKLGDPRFDPHGDPIPTESGELPPRRGVMLPECPPGWTGRIIHIEDEPRGTFQNLIEAGLAPGMPLRIDRSSPEGVELELEGNRLRLDVASARQVLVEELEVEERYDDSISRLSSLKGGEQADVVGLSPACRGAERNRLLDLGLVPGSTIEIVLSSPSGNPTAYRIRGAHIALRKSQADKVLIRRPADRPESTPALSNLEASAS